jgi:hypothetical protein
MSKVLPGIVLLGFGAVVAWAWRAYRMQRLQNAQVVRDINRWEDEGGQGAARRPPSGETSSYLV